MSRKIKLAAKPVPAPTPRKRTVAETVRYAEERFVCERDREIDDLKEATGKFLEDATDNPLYAVEWHTSSVARNVGSNEEWRLAMSVYEKAGKGLAGFEAVVAHVAQRVERFMDLNSWEYASTNQYANAIHMAKAKGAAKALQQIRWAASFAVENIREALDDEANSETPEQRAQRLGSATMGALYPDAMAELDAEKEAELINGAV